MIDINTIHVIDDVIPKMYQEAIKAELFGAKMAWRYMDEATGRGYGDPAMSHIFFSKKQNHASEQWDFVAPLLYTAVDKIDFNIRDIIQARSFLQFPLREELTIKSPIHIDMAQEHLVVLYYVNDSDGPTKLYKNTTDTTHPDWGSKITGDPIKIVDPKQGRVVIFNGKRFHAGSYPTKDVRCIINFNVI